MSHKQDKTCFFFTLEGNNLWADRRGANILTSVILSELTPVVRNKCTAAEATATGCELSSSHTIKLRQDETRDSLFANKCADVLAMYLEVDRTRQKTGSRPRGRLKGRFMGLVKEEVRFVGGSN